MKTIPNQTLTNIEGYPMQIEEKDADGGFVYLNPDEPDSSKRQKKMKDATAADIIKLIIFSTPRSIAKDLDYMRVPAMYNRLEAAQNGSITMKEKLYDWLHRLLSRPVPLTPDNKELGMTQQSYAREIWGLGNAEWVVNQLRDKDEQRSKAELFPDEED